MQVKEEKEETVNQRYRTKIKKWLTSLHLKMILIKMSKKTTIANVFTNHSSQNIQDRRPFNEHFIQYQKYTKEKEIIKEMWLDIKNEKANCKSLTRN